MNNNKFFVPFIFLLLLGFSATSKEVKNQKMMDRANKWNSEQFAIVKKNFSCSARCDTSKIKLVALQTAHDLQPNYYKALGKGKQRFYAEVAASTIT